MQNRNLARQRPDFYNPVYYSIAKRSFFRFDFPGLEDVQINHSQLHQDLFVLSALNGKRGGTYLEIGAHEPIFISNTALLEQVFEWRGIGLEINPEMVAGHKRLRQNPCLHADALQVDIKTCIESAELPNVIDYLSIDIDPPSNSLSALKRIPHEQYRFRIITFEHDLSFGGAHERKASRDFLQGLGYRLVVGDVSWCDHTVEDWWVDPALTDPKIIKRMTPADPFATHRHDEYFYNIRTEYEGGMRVHGKAGSTIGSGLDHGICVEGWRHINHSFSLVNQWQLLQLLRHPVRLRHRDVPFYNPQWNAGLNHSGFSNEASERIRHIPDPTPDDYFSAIYRISFPMNLSEGRAEKIFVFGTTEAGACTDAHFDSQGISLIEVTKHGNIRIVTPSKWSQQGFVNSGCPENAIHVVPHGVSTATFQPVEADLRKIYRKILGFEDEDFVLLNIGNLIGSKGTDLLLEAYANLKPNHPNLKLVVKDQSNLYSFTLTGMLRQMAEAGREVQLSADEWQGVIQISDNLDLESLRAIYNACDAYVSPYRAEGFNLPPLEAAACGLPIIVTAGGSTDDYFTPELGLQVDSTIQHDGKWTYLQPDLEALQNAIERVMDAPQCWGGRDGSIAVHDRFGWERVGERLWNLLSGT